MRRHSHAHLDSGQCILQDSDEVLVLFIALSSLIGTRVGDMIVVAFLPSRNCMFECTEDGGWCIYWRSEAGDLTGKEGELSGW